MKTKFLKGKIILEDIAQDFEPKHIFECGQCFRWNEEKDGSFTGVVEGKIINVEKKNNLIIFNNSTEEDYYKIFEDYFDLKRNYTGIKENLQNPNMKQIIEFGKGIRILNQDEWETLVSFILSANNRIFMIKRVIDNLAQNYGDYIGDYKGKKYYSFPSPEKLNKLEIKDFQNLKAGFRARYIKDAARVVSSNKNWLYNLKNESYEKALEELKSIKGIGDKVGNCILLFSMKKYQAFPVDVWMKRIMKKIFSIDGNPVKVRKESEKMFGQYSGFAQQYLFYYASQGKLDEYESYMK